MSQPENERCSVWLSQLTCSCYTCSMCSETYFTHPSIFLSRPLSKYIDSKERLMNIWNYSCFKLHVTQLCIVPELSHLETTLLPFSTLASIKYQAH